MNAADLLHLRLAQQGRIRNAVLADFEVTDSRRDQVRRMVVVKAAAERLRVNHLDWRFIGRVSMAVQALGGEAVKPKNRRMWRKVRRRA